MSGRGGGRSTKRRRDESTAISIDNGSEKEASSVPSSISKDRIRHAVIKVRKAVNNHIKPLSLDQRLLYLGMLTAELKALKRNNQSQRSRKSRKASKGRPASLSH